MAIRNVSGATITQTESGQTVVSTCPGSVRFHIGALGAIRHYTVPAGVYNDCQDSMDGTYASGSSTAAAGAGHAVEITLVETVDTVTVEFGWLNGVDELMANENVSGLTIRNLSTGQVATSTCPGNVRFHNPSSGAHNYSVDAGTGHFCDTNLDQTTSAFPSTSEGPGAVELTVSIAGTPLMRYTLPLISNQAPSTSAVSNQGVSNSASTWETDATVNQNIVGGTEPTILEGWSFRATNAPGPGKTYTLDLVINGASNAAWQLIVTNSVLNPSVTFGVPITLNPGDVWFIQCTPSGNPAAMGTNQRNFTFVCHGQLCQVSSSLNHTDLANTTAFLAPEQRGQFATEILAQFAWPIPGTAKGLYFGSQLDPGNGKTYSATMRKAGVNTALTCQIVGNGSTNKQAHDTTHTVALAAGDIISFAVTNGVGAVTNRPFLSWQFVPDTNFQVVYPYEIGVLGGNTQYVAGEVVNTSDDSKHILMPACTVSTLGLYVNSGAPNALQTITATVRNSGVDTSITTSITGPAVGPTQDTTHTSVFAADAPMTVKAVNGAGALVTSKAMFILSFR